MEIKFTTLVLNIISGLLPGNGLQFLKDGGMVFAIGHPSKEVVVYHPGLPENIKLRLLDVANKSSQQITFLEHPNFEGCSLEEIAEVEGTILNFLLKTHPCARIRRNEESNLICIYLPNVSKKEDDVLEFLISFLKSIEGLSVAYINLLDGCIRVVPDKAIVMNDVKNDIEHGAITEADVQDITISLESAKTVDEFLKGLGG